MGALDYLPSYTYSDYKDWEGKWELFEGHPIAMSPAPMISHQAIAFEMARELGNKLEKCNRCLLLCEADWKINDNTVLRPDVVLICDETHDTYMTKSPEIIIEVISKSTAKRDENYKFDMYEKEKVKYYIIVYPDDLKAKIYKLEGSKYDKQGDFSLESYNFEETLCKASIDFSKVFKKFRK